MTDQPLLMECPVHGRVNHAYKKGSDGFLCRLATPAKRCHFVPSEHVRCEHEGCGLDGWTVLHFGAGMAAPRRIACVDHRRVTDLSKFRDDGSQGRGL